MHRSYRSKFIKDSHALLRIFLTDNTFLHFSFSNEHTLLQIEKDETLLSQLEIKGFFEDKSVTNSS